tara:strand:- start:20269 stop:21222 length:954 start_codon:yes stop_codon:yes gene_type:complete
MTGSIKDNFLNKVKEKGGFQSYHAHFDKSHILEHFNLSDAMCDMQNKWYEYRKFKENYTEDDLTKRMNRCIDEQYKQGTNYTRTFIDCDSLVKQLPIDTAIKLKEEWKNKIKIDLAIQPLEGVFGDSQKEYVRACEKADIIGGLPSRDKGKEDDHLDFILNLGKSLNKKIDVHIDQANAPYEKETEQLARHTMKWGLEGNVTGVHAISLSCHPIDYQNDICKMLKDAGITIVICPSAALGMRQLSQYNTPIHNSIAPVELLLKHEVPIVLGIDNISDLFMPLVDGDLWFECRLLMEATRIYDLDVMSDVASGKLLRN